jgi:hypothetical protein
MDKHIIKLQVLKAEELVSNIVEFVILEEESEFELVFEPMEFMIEAYYTIFEYNFFPMDEYLVLVDSQNMFHPYSKFVPSSIDLVHRQINCFGLLYNLSILSI